MMTQSTSAAVQAPVSATTDPEVLTEAAISQVLGIEQHVPLDPASMAASLRVTFFPSNRLTHRLGEFVDRLREALRQAGVTVLPFDEALQPARSGGSGSTGAPKRKLREHIVVIAAGEMETGNLPVDYVSNLRTTTVVGIVDGPCPGNGHANTQERLDSIVRTLSWNIVQVVIFVEDECWTICTMNGAVIPCREQSSFQGDVEQTLVPKLAAPVVPPHTSDFDFEEGALDLSGDSLSAYVDDFRQSGPLWGKTGLMLFHTSLSSLKFRSPFYKRIAAAYLDRRSGMSYGFLARQLATPVRPALRGHEADALAGGTGWRTPGTVRIDGKLHVAARLGAETYLVEVPEVSVLSTRSGCDKSNIDGDRDLMLMTLSNGRITFKTPGAGLDYRPSYDTVTILAHAVGNALIASLQLCTNAQAAFARTLQKAGLALAHWHGTIHPNLIPPTHRFHGEENPPVSCSTHQSAIYSLAGKLQAYRSSVADGTTYEGDVHVEPHHGINVTWPTLTGLARKILQGSDKSA